MSVNKSYINKSINEKGFAYFNFKKIQNINELTNFVKKFGKLKNMKNFNTHNDSDYVQVFYRDGTKKKKYFGDIFHSDYQFEKRPPKYTFLYCHQITQKSATTSILDRVKFFSILSSKEKEYLLKNKFLISIPEETKKKFNIKKKDLYKYSKKIFGANCYKKKTIINVSPYHTKNVTKELARIFSKIEKYKIDIKWKKNHILIWNNRLVFHKAGSDSPSTRVMYRLLCQ